MAKTESMNSGRGGNKVVRLKRRTGAGGRVGEVDTKVRRVNKSPREAGSKGRTATKVEAECPSSTTRCDQTLGTSRWGALECMRVLKAVFKLSVLP